MYVHIRSIFLNFQNWNNMLFGKWTNLFNLLWKYLSTFQKVLSVKFLPNLSLFRIHFSEKVFIVRKSTTSKEISCLRGKDKSWDDVTLSSLFEAKLIAFEDQSDCCHNLEHVYRLWQLGKSQDTRNPAKNDWFQTLDFP